MKTRSQIIISIVVAVLIVVVGFWFSKKNQGEKNITIETSTGEEYSISNTDWKDSLSGLFKKEEVEEPTVSYEELTETEKLAGLLTSNYFNLKQGNNPISLENKELLASGIANTIKSIKLTDDYYTKDVAIVTSNTTTLYQYGNALGAMLISNYPKGELSEGKIIFEALRDEDPNKIKELLPIIDGYKSIRDDLLNIPVPEGLDQYHLEFVNGTNNIAKMIEIMITIFENPLLSMQALQTYTNEGLRIATSMDQIHKAVKKSNPSYKQSESGYYFLYGI